ncbi:hypothetical protein Y032_0161g3388 [Ancylostoma ceylanicum]|uniref:Uncharacterized protein n=1 Tax=Ancylostoma ceylanicum TaxID=53326 RepID=A0A016SY02_9BILA|nr:hypothetical protein Y032_0161g3388 [Ancylostoma ceylanicum]
MSVGECPFFVSGTATSLMPFEAFLQPCVECMGLPIQIELVKTRKATSSLASTAENFGSTAKASVKRCGPQLQECVGTDPLDIERDTWMIVGNEWGMNERSDARGPTLTCESLNSNVAMREAPR